MDFIPLRSQKLLDACRFDRGESLFAERSVKGVMVVVELNSERSTCKAALAAGEMSAGYPDTGQFDAASQSARRCLAYRLGRRANGEIEGEEDS